MIYVFLPAYNEALALGPVVQKFSKELEKRSEKFQFVVLDDGSADGTSAVAQRLAHDFPLALIKHAKNMGLGKTMQDGLAYLAKESSPDDLIVTLDCDDTHEPQYVHAALDKAREGFDLVILSRYQKGGGEVGLAFVKSILSRGAGLLLKIFFPIPTIWEYSCGYRVFRASALKKAHEVFGDKFIRLPHMGFVVTPEILIKLRMLGCRITEVPFVLHYENKPGASKNKPLKTIAGYFFLIILFWTKKIQK